MELLLIIILLVLTAWTLWGHLSSQVEQTEYTVIKKTGFYEIRNYPAHIVAQTTIAGPYRNALQQGFRIVAGYIFGRNTKKESIAMTAPVIQQKRSGQSIAMTAPVMANIEGDIHTISFGMPRSYTLKTLPIPSDSRVKLVEVPPKKMAVKRFSMYRTDRRVHLKQQQLLSALAKDSITVVGEPQYAGYNAPWTPPWMMRNEVLIEII